MTYQLTLKIASPTFENPLPHAFITISGPNLTDPVTVGFSPREAGTPSGAEKSNPDLPQRLESNGTIHIPTQVGNNAALASDPSEITGDQFCIGGAVSTAEELTYLNGVSIDELQAANDRFHPNSITTARSAA